MKKKRKNFNLKRIIKCVFLPWDFEYENIWTISSVCYCTEDRKKQPAQLNHQRKEQKIRRNCIISTLKKQKQTTKV